MKPHEVGNYKPEFIREYLRRLLKALDKLDEDDFFGTEGWRHRLMGED